MRDLTPLHPRLRDGIPKILEAMKIIGFPMMVTDTLRTTQEQQALYAQGRTAPGLIVTRADGVTNRSNHQQHADGFGHAVDCCFLVDGHASWDEKLPWRTYGALGVALGFAWGGDWPGGNLHDLPHLELVETIGQRA